MSPGYDARGDAVRAELTLSEIGDLSMELCSLTQGLGAYEVECDCLAERKGVG
jgi:translation elongation factor EF-G